MPPLAFDDLVASARGHIDRASFHDALQDLKQADVVLLQQHRATQNTRDKALVTARQQHVHDLMVTVKVGLTFPSRDRPLYRAFDKQGAPFHRFLQANLLDRFDNVNLSVLATRHVRSVLRCSFLDTVFGAFVEFQESNLHLLLVLLLFLLAPHHLALGALLEASTVLTCFEGARELFRPPSTPQFLPLGKFASWPLWDSVARGESWLADPWIVSLILARPLCHVVLWMLLGAAVLVSRVYVGVNTAHDVVSGLTLWWVSTAVGVSSSLTSAVLSQHAFPTGSFAVATVVVVAAFVHIYAIPAHFPSHRRTLDCLGLLLGVVVAHPFAGPACGSLGIKSVLLAGLLVLQRWTVSQCLVLKCPSFRTGVFRETGAPVWMNHVHAAMGQLAVNAVLSFGLRILV